MTPIKIKESPRGTSCVEAGVDFSFRTVFRESCGLVNLLQAAGRVCRGGECADAEVSDFWRDEFGFLNLHPHFKTVPEGAH